MNSAANDAERAIQPYNKYANDKHLPTDIPFAKDAWMSFQFCEIQFDSVIDFELLKQKCNLWARKHIKRDANVNTWNGSARSYVESITRQRPSEVISNTTHLITVCDNNTIVGFLDHYYNDGKALLDYLVHVFVAENEKDVIFPKYQYIPILSDAVVIDWLGRRTLDMVRYPPQLTTVGPKTTLLKRQFSRSDADYFDSTQWNRWSNYAVSTNPVFEATPSLRYLHIGLTIGFDTDCRFGNNRIGVIVVRIDRPSSQMTYYEKIQNLIEQFKSKATDSYVDAHTSYDFFRGFDTVELRKYGSTCVDIIFTSFQLKLNEKITYCMAGFVGSCPDEPFTYINTFTAIGSDTTNVTMVSNTTTIDCDKLVECGMTKVYEFEHNDPTQR
jgi:hypothetical protein